MNYSWKDFSISYKLFNYSETQSKKQNGKFLYFSSYKFTSFEKFMIFVDSILKWSRDFRDFSAAEKIDEKWKEKLNPAHNGEEIYRKIRRKQLVRFSIDVDFLKKSLISFKLKTTFCAHSLAWNRCRWLAMRKHFMRIF